MALDQELDEDVEKGIDGTEMSFIDHLEELRWHILRSASAVLVFTIIAWIYKDFIFGSVVLGPTKADFWTNRMLCKLADITHLEGLCFTQASFILQSREVSGQFMMALTQSIIVGVLFSFPYFFWEIWRFIKPGLRGSEKTITRGAVFYVTALFMCGVLFGYYIVAPLAINFLATFKLDESIKNQFSVNSYVSLLAVLTLACGLTFQLPVVAFVLSRVGIINPRLMREYRRYAFVAILIIAAIITPSPDVLSQILVSIPLWILYEISIFVSAYVERAKKADAEAETP